MRMIRELLSLAGLACLALLLESFALAHGLDLPKPSVGRLKDKDIVEHLAELVEKKAAEIIAREKAAKAAAY